MFTFISPLQYNTIATDIWIELNKIISKIDIMSIHDFVICAK